MIYHDEWDYGPFKVGDVVEWVGQTGEHAKWNGVSTRIIKALSMNRRNKDGIMILSYVTDTISQSLLQVGGSPGELRRRKPPMNGLEDVLAMFDKQPDRAKELA